MNTATISADHLCVGYGKHPVVEGVMLDMHPGELLVLIGTNGSGKSTLLKTLAGLIHPVHGDLHVLGQHAGQLPTRVAYLPQHPVSSHTLPLQVRDVVTMGRFAHLGLFKRTSSSDRDIVSSAMQRTGIDAQANKPIRDLSGGQQQRTHLAQVLAREAEILLLDEPTAGLDINGRKLVAELIAAERARGVTVVMATHELADAEHATSVLLLAQRVVSMGPPQEALRDEYLRECFGFTQPH
ncbi:MAG: metal ABC transporter ATP-binding protein [Actinobacteria bacterium]|jgi:ABC-type Mn2+/Zn2+ transport system ATPase subunit|nr:metal ABC transporter ATP-binding protein [Actinomycetota bacterium]